MSLVLGLAGEVGGGSAWHTTAFRASRALWGSAASGEFANSLSNSLTAATEQSLACDIKLTQFIEPIEFINLIHLCSSRFTCNLSLITLGFLASS